MFQQILLLDLVFYFYRNGTGATVGHRLGAVPKFIIVKGETQQEDGKPIMLEEVQAHQKINMVF